jgi:hypothetical protein
LQFAARRNIPQGYRQLHYSLEDTSWIQTVSLSSVRLEEAREIQIAHCSPSGDLRLRDIGSITASRRNRPQGNRQPHFRLEDTLWIQTVSLSAAKRRPKDTDSLIQCSLEEAIEIQTALHH